MIYLAECWWTISRCCNVLEGPNWISPQKLSPCTNKLPLLWLSCLDLPNHSCQSINRDYCGYDWPNNSGQLIWPASVFYWPDKPNNSCLLIWSPSVCYWFDLPDHSEESIRLLLVTIGYYWLDLPNHSENSIRLQLVTIGYYSLDLPNHSKESIIHPSTTKVIV